MKILSNNDIKEIERYTIDNDGVTSVQLVERAARVFDRINLSLAEFY